MLHELNAKMLGNPRDALLSSLVGAGTEIPELLSRLAALHAGGKETHLPLRDVNVHTGEHFYPHADDVPALLVYFAQKLNGLWTDCRAPEDDLFVVAFGMYGILSIQPFARGNVRTAMDFAQYLLMLRWGLDSPPMDLPADGGKLLGGLFADALPACDGESAEAFDTAKTALASQFESTTLQHLKQTKSYQIAAHWMRDALRTNM